MNTNIVARQDAALFLYLGLAGGDNTSKMEKPDRRKLAAVRGDM